MSKAFNRKVAASFTTSMAKFLPQFAAAKADRVYGWPGEKAFSRVSSGRSDWLALYFSKDGRDEFTVDVGWSYLKRYPLLPARPMAGSIDKLISARAKEAFVRVRPLSGCPMDWWSLSIGPGGDSVEELVSDAIHCIERFALPALGTLPDENA